MKPDISTRLPGTEADLLRLAGAVRQSEGDAGEPSRYRHAVFAEQHRVHGLAGGRRNGGSDSRLRQKRGQLGGSACAVRSYADATSRSRVILPRGMQSIRLPPAPSRKSAVACVMAGPTNSRCSSGSWRHSSGRILQTDDPPLVAVNANSGDPHYEPHPGSRRQESKKGTSFFSTSGARRLRPGLCITTSRGPGLWARRPAIDNARFSTIVTKARDMGVKTVLDGVASRPQHGRAGRWIERCATSSRKLGSAITSFIAPAIPSRPRFTRTARTWTILRSMTSARILPNTCLLDRARYLLCRSSACAARSTCWCVRRAAEVTGKIQREIVII